MTGQMLNMIGETWSVEPATKAAAAEDAALSDISQCLTDILAHQLEHYQPERKWQLRGDVQLILQLAEQRIAEPAAVNLAEQLASHRSSWQPEPAPEEPPSSDRNAIRATSWPWPSTISRPSAPSTPAGRRCSRTRLTITRATLRRSRK